jgi:hypothetical protein
MTLKERFPGYLLRLVSICLWVVFCWCAYFFTCKNSPKMLTNHTSCHPNTQTPPPNTMACSSVLGCHHIPINLEWVESQVGLRLIIPNSWWPAYHNDGLNLGHIATINLDKPRVYYFQVQLDDDEYLYGILESVLLYVDSDQPGFTKLLLPACCPSNPDNKMVQVSVPLH